MPDDITPGGTPDGEAGNGADLVAGAATTDPEPLTAADADGAGGKVTPPVGMFRPTMHDGSSASETAGRTVAPRPMERDGDGGGMPCDGAADQVLILGPSEAGQAGDAPGLVADAADETSPTVAAGLIDGTNLFGDRAAQWSGDPSEVGAVDGFASSYAGICLCDGTDLAAGEVTAFGS